MMVRITTQCISKGVVSEGDYGKDLDTMQREKEFAVVQKTVRKSLFQPPQQLHYGFNPIPVEGRENFLIELNDESFETKKAKLDESIELLNIPGPPYQQTVDEIQQQKTHSGETITEGINTNKYRPSKKNIFQNTFRQKHEQHKNSFAANHHQSNIYEDGTNSKEGFRKIIQKFENFQGFPGFDSFDIGLVPE